MKSSFESATRIFAMDFMLANNTIHGVLDGKKIEAEILRSENGRLDLSLDGQRMRAALREFIVHGVTTNIDFMGALLAHEDFKNGQVTTRWVETKFGWQASEPTVEALVAAAIAEMGQKSQVEGRSAEAYSPWKVTSGFRIGG